MLNTLQRLVYTPELCCRPDPPTGTTDLALAEAAAVVVAAVADAAVAALVVLVESRPLAQGAAMPLQ